MINGISGAGKGITTAIQDVLRMLLYLYEAFGADELMEEARNAAESALQALNRLLACTGRCPDVTDVAGAVFYLIGLVSYVDAQSGLLDGIKGVFNDACARSIQYGHLALLAQLVLLAHVSGGQLSISPDVYRQMIATTATADVPPCYAAALRIAHADGPRADVGPLIDDAAGALERKEQQLTEHCGGVLAAARGALPPPLRPRLSAQRFAPAADGRLLARLERLAPPRGAADVSDAYGALAWVRPGVEERVAPGALARLLRGLQ